MTYTIDRAGFWRRALAFAVDAFVASAMLATAVAIAYAPTDGRVTGWGFLMRCESKLVRPGELALPRGVALPKGFAPTEQGTCRWSLFGATTRLVYVAIEQHGNRGPRTTVAYPVGADGGSAVRTFDADFLFLPLFVLLRWLADRFAGGSLGRRLARIAVTDRSAAATGRALATDLARRYARFAWPLLPGLALGALSAAWSLTVGPPPFLLQSLAWLAGSAVWSTACALAFVAIVRRRDTAYDAPVGTVVAPRLEIERAETGPAERSDPCASVWTDAAAGIAAAARSTPRLSIVLVAAMTLVFAAEWWLPASPANADGTVSLATRLVYGGMDRELVVMLGQVYRLLTSIVLHGSWTHLALNAAALLGAGWLLEEILGGVLFGGLFLFGGLAASLTSIAFNPPQELSVGASGAVLAVLAAALPLSVRVPAGARRGWMRVWPFIVIVVSLVPGLPAQALLKTDLAAHFGGVAAGLILGTAIALVWRGGVRREPSRRTAAAIAGLVAVAALAPIPVFGWREPLLAVALVPAAEAPPTDEGWRERSKDLVRRFPDDPRVMLGQAAADIDAGDTAAGFRDLDRAIALQRRLAPSVSGDFRFAAHVEVGGRLFDRGDLDLASAQYTLALDEKPNAEIYRDRGIAEFYLRKTADALADLQHANAIDPKEGYTVLWLSIVAVRAGYHDPIAATANGGTGDAWPQRIVAYFKGQMDAEALVASGQTLDIVEDAHRVCEAKFYMGEHLIMRGWSDEARPLIEEAARTCPPDFIEHRAALEEMAGAAEPPSH